MKKRICSSSLLAFLASFILLAGFTSCSEEDELSASGSYGYIQLNLQKAGTRAVIEGNALDYLRDARKVKLSLRRNGVTVEQTLNLLAVSDEAAEYGLTSENLKLLSGNYELLSYAIYGEYKSGDMVEVLQVCKPDAPVNIEIRPGEITRQSLDVEAKVYGTFSARLIRLEPEVEATRAPAPIYSGVYSFADIDSVQLVFQRTLDGVQYREDRKVKAIKADSDQPVFNTEDMQLQAGNYTITHVELYNKRRQFMYAQDVEIPFEVKHHEQTKTEVGVQQPLNDGIRDGIALKQIWSAMDGKSWSWHENDGNGGANWVFTMDDGSPRPISSWTHQIGVVVISGRVVSLNIGSFNPLGDVPDAIGQLTALEKLYLGMHTDDVYYTLEGVDDLTGYSLNPWQLAQTTDTRLHRMDIARERTIIRRMNAADQSSRTSRLLYKGKSEVAGMFANMTYATRVTPQGGKSGASAYSLNTNNAANRITGISPEIGKLTNLQELYIGNSCIKSLPMEMQNLSNVTDLEFYNNPFLNVDGEIFKNMKDLTSVYFDSFYNMNETQLQDMLNKMCLYCPKIQLLYINHMGLTHLPSQLKLLTDLRLLDASYNKITSVSSLKPMAPIQIMLNYNQLTELPEDFINVADLELFSITDNCLKEFPVVLSNLDGLYTIEEVDLTGNRMHGFQSGFHGIRVEKLKIGHNQMGRLAGTNSKGQFPREFSDTHSQINYLVIAGNNIDTITNAAIDNIKNLQAFDFSVNNLKGLPSHFDTSHFPYLTGVDCSHNQFDNFPSNILNVNSLGQLLISDQGYFRDAAEKEWVRTMKVWPENLHLHSALTNLNMSGNDFRTVLNFPINLTTLNVTNNPNIKMVVPQSIIYKMEHGLFVLYYDEGQDITAE